MGIMKNRFGHWLALVLLTSQTFPVADWMGMTMDNKLLCKSNWEE
jgi:hypothetical protein